jgi:purine-cytosine permease-like protein
MVFGIDLSTGWLIGLIGIELIVGFLIGYIILSRAFKWALIAIIVLGILLYFGLVSTSVITGGIKDILSSDHLMSLLTFISAPLVVGMILGWLVKKIF